MLPLSIGNHIDHLLVRNSVEALRDGRNINLGYYEDFPYVYVNKESTWVSKLTSGLTPQVIEVSPKESAKRLAAINCYRSQLDMLWEDNSDKISQMNSVYERYGKKYGGKVVRLWERIV
ncbi:MAG: hypothetical protein Q8P30_03700 [Candidatus Uhrbacteria bacterium]|nr:hypothetical protein [Candidatus Uhrbacteria bacterium]